MSAQPPPRPTAAPAAPSIEELGRGYADAIERGDDQEARQVIEAALAGGVDGVRVIGDVLTPAMRRIGDLWEQNRIGVADEHLATAITERALAQVYPTLFRASPLSRERVIVSSVEGEQHVLGLRMVADILEGNGYEVLFLGADVRVSALLAAIDQHRPAAIALGCTGTWSTETLLTTLTQLQRHPSLPIMLGGIGVPERVPPEGLTLMRVTHIDQLPAAMEQALGPRTGASEVAASA